MKLGVVTTVKSWDRSVEQWVAWHRAIGFDRLYVFCDDPSSGPAEPPAELRLFHCDDDHWRCFGNHKLAVTLDAPHRRGTPSWREPEFLMMRQSLNAELALFLAVQEKIGWLLHIDGDELFHPGAESPREHFARLEAEGIEQARYLNKEAVVLSDGVEDFFTELTLFKVNPKLLSQDQWALVSRAMGEKPYFLAYANGKSAMRVSPDALTSGVHGFRKRDGGRARSVFSEPAILHYPYGSYARFRSRHEVPDAEPLEVVLQPAWRPLPLFAITKLPIAAGNPDALRPLFERWVVLGDDASREALIAGKVIETIEQPARRLKKA